ncbi:helix-turn-helix transcriptional regulator [Streptomyces sp. NPDC002889]|uniref:helix-turn-helix domain-containing protein n=1 Tax=Streptomyces sp. NPDC002889 TaxID=3364669 RepID=UPI0036CCBC4E
MPGPDLTDRELHVLRRSAQGEIYDRIAADWGVTGRTVKQIASRMFKKLGATSMPNAVLLACQAGLLDGRPRRHGDHAGFMQHVRAGEDAWDCEPCATGERAYRAERRAARRATKTRAGVAA